MKITWDVFHDDELIEKGEFNPFFWRGGIFTVLLDGQKRLSIESNVNHGILIEDIGKALVGALETDNPQTFHTYSTSKSYDVIFLGRVIEFRNFDPETLKTLRRSILPKIAFIDAFKTTLCHYLNTLKQRNETIVENELFQRIQKQLVLLNAYTE
ncbi:hypothetical protein [Kurthia massiliensis]|uniref:hypothetical protein n=1 Tax=Kurthia massiliensis TaxID=1033739 RepID=UPI000289DB04|nr:hypothetical protein [Kurthia massiliensis]